MSNNDEQPRRILSRREAVQTDDQPLDLSAISSRSRSDSSAVQHARPNPCFQDGRATYNIPSPSCDGRETHVISSSRSPFYNHNEYVQQSSFNISPCLNSQRTTYNETNVIPSSRTPFYNQNNHGQQGPFNVSQGLNPQRTAYNINSFPPRTINEHYNPQVKDLLPLLIDYNPTMVSLKAFIQNIDRIMNMYQPHELTLIHAVTLKLKENARKWYDSLGTYFQSWDSLRNALIAEFAETRDTVDIHRELEKRRCKLNEDVVDYAYDMRRIASEADIPEKDVIKYIISGLNNTHLIYSLSIMKITAFTELMMRLRAHKTIAPPAKVRDSSSSSFNPGPSVQRNNTYREHPYRRPIQCSYCHREGHVEINCRFKINRTNAINEKQSKSNDNNSNVKLVNCIVANTEYIKTISLNNVTLEAFIDLGSECTLIDETVARKIFLNFDTCQQILRGFGNGSCTATGKVYAHLEIDGIVLSECEILIVNKLSQPAKMIIGQNILNRENILVVKGYNYLKLINVSFNKNNLEELENYFAINQEVIMPNVLAVQKDDFSDIITSAIGPDVDENCKAYFIKLCQEFRDCFASNMSELGLTHKAEIKITLKDDKPVCYQPYRLSFAQREVVASHIKEMLENNIIKPSTSPYAAPIVIVKKKTGEDRICVDYRRLNAKTIKDHYPLPNMDDQLQRLAGKKYFTVMDLASGYYQLPVAVESRVYTAFVTPDGKYEFQRMPFGLVNAPSTFQRMINTMTCELENKIIPYLDDVVIASETIEEGVKLLKLFLTKLREYGLTLKPTKCKFLQQSIEFLGHEVDHDGIRPGKEKIKCVENFETPTSVRDIRRFIGLASYFRKFVPKFAEIAKPLTDLTRKDLEFKWNLEQDDAFNRLKTHLCARETLALYDPNAEHEVHTDASAVGLAGILIQVTGKTKRPVSYFSRKTNDTERNYHSYELETLAVVESVERFRVYLLGKRFVVITDCESLRTSATKKHLIPRVARWWLRMQEFDFDIRHRTGSQMSHVDALSRAPVLEVEGVDGASLDVFSVRDESKWMIALQKTDLEILKLKKTIEENRASTKEYVIRDDCVYFKTEHSDELFVLPKHLRGRMVADAHSAAHFGLEKTLNALKKHYWFHQMRGYVKRHISTCVECLFNKEKRSGQGIELHSIEKVPIPQHTWHIDHIGPFIKSSRKNAYVIVIVDAFTKYVNLKAAKDTSARCVVKAIDELIIHFGSPTRIITDRGAAFTSNCFQKYCTNLNIKHILNATATPRANGQVERVNETFLNSLRTKVDGENEQNWELNLREIQWTINSTANSVTRKSPHEMLFGYTPRSIYNNKLTLQLEDNEVVTTRQNYVEKTQVNREEASKNIKKHQEYSKRYFDARHKKPTEFSVNDLVMAKREVVSTGTSTKLQPKFRGPYLIIEKLHGDRYRVTDIAPVENKRKYIGVFPAEKLKLVDRPEVTTSESDNDD